MSTPSPLDPFVAVTDARTRIVVEASRLLREHGSAGLTTRAVAEAAGVQAPAIYRQFGDKDGLVEAVAEHVMQTFVAEKRLVAQDARDGGRDPVEDLRDGWRSWVEFGVANPALFLLLVDPRRAATSAASRAGRDVLRSRIRRIAAAGRLRVPQDRAVDLVHAAGTGAVLAVLAHGAPDLADDLGRAVLDRILVRDVEGPSTEPAYLAPAVALRADLSALPGLSDPERVLLGEWLDRVAAASTGADAG